MKIATKIVGGDFFTLHYNDLGEYEVRNNGEFEWSWPVEEAGDVNDILLEFERHGFMAAFTQKIDEVKAKHLDFIQEEKRIDKEESNLAQIAYFRRSKK